MTSPELTAATLKAMGTDGPHTIQTAIDSSDVESQTLVGRSVEDGTIFTPAKDSSVQQLVTGMSTANTALSAIESATAALAANETGKINLLTAIAAAAGAPADNAYAGSGNTTSIGGIKGLFALLAGNLKVVLQAGGNVIGAVTQSGSWVLSAGTALIGKVGIDQTTPGTTNKVSLGNDVVTTADQNGAAFGSAVTLTAGGASDSAGRSVEMLVTVAGNVSLQLSSGSAHVISVAASPYTQTFPYAITAINSSGTTATATYANLH